MNKNKLLLPGIFLLLLIVGEVLFYQMIPKTGYVLSQRVFNEFKLKKDLEKKLAVYQKKQQKELDSLKLEVQLKYSELRQKKVRQGTEISEYTQKEQQFLLKEKQTVEEYETLSDQYTQQIWKQVNQYIKEYGQEKSYKYIFGAKGEGDLMYAEERENITDEVLNYINAKYEGDIK
jgi:outer membrane protein